MASTTVIHAPLSTSILRLEPRPQVNAAQLSATLHESCQFGNFGPDGAGMNRLSLNGDDALVRRWLVERLKDVEREVKVDEMGNLFGIFPGKDMTLPPIAIGSHLDIQPAGGRFDGILGVMCGLEIIRAVKESGYRTNAPLVCINWTNEEGARHSCKDSAGISVRSEIQKHGFLGVTPSSFDGLPISAHFEVHIEQNPILCDESNGAPATSSRASKASGGSRSISTAGRNTQRPP